MYINIEEFKNTGVYQNFISQNPENGYLKIKAYSASEAIPISGVKVIVSKIIDNDKIIFFSGMTDESGVIERIVLPAPKLNANNLESPSSTTYDIESIYQNIDRNYSVKMFEDVCVVQNINIIPPMGMRGNIYGN